MGILSRFTGSSQQRAATRGVRGRSVTGKGMGGRTKSADGRGATGGGFQGFSRSRRSSAGRGTAQPSSPGGLAKLMGSFKRR